MDYSEYKKHPRILELRFILTHTNFVMNYGLERTAEIFSKLAEAARINWSILSSLIGRKDMILADSISNKKRYRQEVFFMGYVFGESKSHTLRNYVRISRRTMYEHYNGELIIENFLNDTWLENLDYSVTVAGVPAYALEIERFLNMLYTISEVTTGVPLAKI